jgi:hypothetical protein
MSRQIDKIQDTLTVMMLSSNHNQIASMQWQEKQKMSYNLGIYDI